MILTFIGASNGTTLAKNLITGDSYPNVTEVNSFSHKGRGIQWIAQVLKLHAQSGNALLTGELDRPLINESRAGHVQRKPTNYLIIDVDSNSLPFSSRDKLLAHLQIDCSYVFQHSAGATSENGLRGHFIIELSEAAEPAKIKNYIKWLNITLLKNHITLSNSQMSLKWPIDPVVNDPGRIVYIAAPIHSNDPIQERIIIVEKARPTFVLPDVPEIDVTHIIEELRTEKQLPKREIQKDQVITIDPNEVKITGTKEERGFVYLNLNGGDSWGYFFDPKQPDLVHNFKDEPEFRLKDLDEDLYHKYARPRPVFGQPLQLDASGNISVTKAAVFRDPEEDTYYQVLYNPLTKKATSFYKTNARSRLNDFMTQHGEPKPGCISDGRIEFDPTNPIQYDSNTRYLNLFRTTNYLEVQETSTEVPKRIEKLLRHITVDQECYDYFLNWLAYIFQYRTKTGTAWLFHGHTGTGKGTLFHKILQPIFGSHAVICNSENLMEQFNGQLRTALMLFVDEFDINDVNNGSKAFNKLKHYITEPTLTIRAMRTEQKQAPSYVNLIMTTNGLIPIKIDDTERRINIPPRQDRPLLGLEELREKLDESDIIGLCRFLRGYKVNKANAHKPIENEARKKMVENSRTSHEMIFHAIKTGNLEFFTDYIGLGSSTTDILNYDNFERTIHGWMAQAKQPGPHEVTREDLFTAYKYINGAGIKPIALIKFVAICKNNAIDFTERRVGGKRRHIIRTHFTPVPDYEAPEKSNIYKIAG